MLKMKRRFLKKRENRILFGIVLTAFLVAIAWTNESVDYLAKLGISNLGSGYVLLTTTFLFTVTLTYTLMEVFKKK